MCLKDICSHCKVSFQVNFFCFLLYFIFARTKPFSIHAFITPDVHISWKRYSIETQKLQSRISLKPRSSNLGSTLNYKSLNFKVYDKMEIWWDGRQIGNGDGEFVETSINEMKEFPDAFLINEDSKEKKSIRNHHGYSNKPIYEIKNDKSQLLLDSKTKKIIGKVIYLKDSSGQDEAIAALGSVEWIIIEAHPNDRTDSDLSNKSWQMIPAENLIAAAQASGTKLAFCVDKAADVGGLSRALEIGVDALCVNAAKTKNMEHDLWNVVYDARRERNKNQNVKYSTDHAYSAVVTGTCWRYETQQTILADRICVDLVQTLAPEEGCWIGSSAKIKALILSESAPSQYVPTRPFRINAGPVHSYILMNDQTTKYLCELQPGDFVEVYNSITKSTRSIAVGRIKQEVRPCVIVEMETSLETVLDDTNEDTLRKTEIQKFSGQIFLQQAETVRLGLENGSYLRVTDLQPNDPKQGILLHVKSAGTHVGKTYTGSVKER